jgi:hypothetical protein
MHLELYLYEYNNQTSALIQQIYFVILPYMFQALIQPLCAVCRTILGSTSLVANLATNPQGMWFPNLFPSLPFLPSAWN